MQCSALQIQPFINYMYKLQRIISLVSKYWVKVQTLVKVLNILCTTLLQSSSFASLLLMNTSTRTKTIRMFFIIHKHSFVVWFWFSLRQLVLAWFMSVSLNLVTSLYIIIQSKEAMAPEKSTEHHSQRVWFTHKTSYAT